MAASTLALTKTVTRTRTRTGGRANDAPVVDSYVVAKYYDLNIVASGDSLVIDTLGATSLVFTTDKSVGPCAVAMNGSGNFVDGATSFPLSDTADGEGTAHSGSAASGSGWVSRLAMPPAVILKNANAADATVQVFITFGPTTYDA